MIPINAGKDQAYNGFYKSYIKEPWYDRIGNDRR